MNALTVVGGTAGLLGIATIMYRRRKRQESEYRHENLIFVRSDFIQDQLSPEIPKTRNWEKLYVLINIIHEKLDQVVRLPHVIIQLICQYLFIPCPGFRENRFRSTSCMGYCSPQCQSLFLMFTPDQEASIKKFHEVCRTHGCNFITINKEIRSYIMQD